MKVKEGGREAGGFTVHSCNVSYQKPRIYFINIKIFC